MEKELAPEQIIDALGGVSKTALICNIKPSSVFEWKSRGIPQARMMFLKLFRPDIFDSAIKKPEASSTE